MEALSITLIIVVLTCAVSLLAFNDRSLKYKLIFSPYQVKHHNEWYRVITHAFIHNDFIHLLFNMYVLYMFGEAVENSFDANLIKLGKYYYIPLYVGGFFFATLPAMRRHSENQHYMSLGASGAVSAVVFSYIIIAPMTPLRLVFLPMIELPAVVFGAIYMAYEIYMDKRGGTRIAHDAHLWGAFYGIVFTITLNFQYLRDFVDAVKGLFT